MHMYETNFRTISFVIESLSCIICSSLENGKLSSSPEIQAIALRQEVAFDTRQNWVMNSVRHLDRYKRQSNYRPGS